MHDRADRVALDQLSDKPLIANVPLNKGRRSGNLFGKTGTEVVDHDDRPAGVDQRKNGVAADVPGTPCDQYRAG